MTVAMIIAVFIFRCNRNSEKATPIEVFEKTMASATPNVTLSKPSSTAQRNSAPMTLATTVLNTQEDDTNRHEAIEALHRSGYVGLTSLVLRVFVNPQESPRFRSFCIQHLWVNSQTAGPEELGKITTALHESLNDRDLPVRRESLLALVRMGDPLGQETAVKWLLDENASNTRDLAIRCVHDLNMKEYIPTIRKYLYDPDEVIRIAAIVALSQWGDEESRPAFSAAAKSDSIRLQRAGQAALTRLPQPIPPTSNP
jgi:HEAT repeat protein